MNNTRESCGQKYDFDRWCNDSRENNIENDKNKKKLYDDYKKLDNDYKKMDDDYKNRKSEIWKKFINRETIISKSIKIDSDTIKF